LRYPLPAQTKPSSYFPITQAGASQVSYIPVSTISDESPTICFTNKDKPVTTDYVNDFDWLAAFQWVAADGHDFAPAQNTISGQLVINKTRPFLLSQPGFIAADSESGKTVAQCELLHLKETFKRALTIELAVRGIDRFTVHDLHLFLVKVAT
jgi:hypothetical protein